jgi:adenine phosphoribosyltransferase
MNLPDHLRTIPDWPKPGVNFIDITPLLRNPAALAMAVEQMVNPFRATTLDVVVGAESRGFIFGTVLARTLNVGFVPIRKPGKLPWKTHRIEYELEYGSDSVEVHQDAIDPGQRALLVDDLLATGGTMKACIDLLELLKVDLVGISVLIELTFLHGREKLKPHDQNLHAVVQY